MARQRVYQIAAGYEVCNDADFMRIDPALRLAIGKDNEPGTRQAAGDSPPPKPDCSRGYWLARCCTCCENSTLWAKRSTVNGMADQASDQGRIENNASRSEVVISDGFCFPLGRILLRRVRVTRAVGKMVDGVTESEVRSGSL